MISENKSKNIILFLVAIIVGVLLGLGLIYITKQKKNYYAVFLNNGNVYFGKLSTFPRLKLDNAIFVQVDDKGQISFPHFKNAFWKPKGSIYLNQNSVLFIAPLAEDSPFIDSIEGRQPMVQQPVQSQSAPLPSTNFPEATSSIQR
jgi:hypothetical protein